MKNQVCKQCLKSGQWVHIGDEYPSDYGYRIVEHYKCKHCGNNARKIITVTFEQENTKPTVK